MGLIFDLAVAALAMVVIGSLAVLTWTLAVGAVRATREGTGQIAELRKSVTDAEARVKSASARASRTMAELTRRTHRHVTPGDPSDR